MARRQVPAREAAVVVTAYRAGAEAAERQALDRTVVGQVLVRLAVSCPFPDGRLK